MNPMNIIRQYITQGLTPKGIISRMGINNPILNNVMGMAQKGDAQGVENFARNICKQKGLDFDTEFNKFKSNFK